jgi:hypothetical protein
MSPHMELNSPHLEQTAESKSKLCYDRRSVGQSVSVSSTHLRLTNRFLILADNCGFVDERTGLPFTTAAGPRQHSHLGPSPAGFMTIFYCLRFETSFPSPPTTHRATVEVFEPASTRGETSPHSWLSQKWLPIITRVALYSLRTDHARKTQFYCCSSPTSQKTFHVTPIVACRQTAEEMCLPLLCVATVAALTS